MTDIASLGLEIRSDGVVVATDRLGKFRKEAGLAEAAAGSLKRLATMGLAAVAAGFAAFGVGIGAAVKRMEEMRKLSAQVDQALKNSGNSARTSAGEIEAWADRLEARTGRAAEEVMAVSANLASFGFSRQAFFRALELADNMSASWGGDLRQNLEGLARALAEPEKGLAMLTKRGITFSDQQKAQIADFVRMNDLAGAQGVVFEALEAQVKGVAESGFTGLEKAVRTAQKVWEDAFESLVRGDGTTKDLRDTLVTLAETVSSPAFIKSVMGFANILVQGMDFVAKAVVAAWAKMEQFLNWLNSQRPGNMVADDLEDQLAQQRADLAKAQQPGNGMGGFFGDATPRQILGLKDRITELEAELAKRSDPTSVNVNGIVDGLGQTYDSPDAMWRGLSPGTMGGQTPFDPYSGMTLGGAEKDKAAAKAKKAYDELTLSAQQYIGQQQLEVQALGMTEEAANKLRYQQDLLNEAANDNLALTPKQTSELMALGAAMAAAEEQTRRLTDIYETGKGIFSSFFGDLRTGIEDGKGLWETLGDAATNALDSIAQKALDMAANGIWDMIFGAVMGGLGGGGSLGNGIGAGAGSFGNFSSLMSFDGGGYTGAGSRSGGLDGKGGFAAMLHPNETVTDHTKGAANQNQANDNRELTVRLIMPEGWQAEVLEQAGENAVRIVQENDKARNSYYMAGGNPR